MSSNWDKELAKIDKQLESISDEALLPVKPDAPPAARLQGEAVQRQTTTFGVMARLLLAVALGVGMVFWPYSARCGAGLFGYLGAVGVLIAAGGWSAVWTWKHRSPKAHVLSLLLMLWGGVLGAQEVLPRIGYAIPTEAHPAAWMCG
ncbi:MAG TPA: hypothetical protein VFZ73_09695 [Gemmatimonadaceae bacterium]